MTKLDRRWLGVRQRFIIRHGVYPWGMLAGVGAATSVVWTAGHTSTGVSVGTFALISLGVFCLVMWTTIVGWAVGTFLWETREQRDPAKSRHVQPR